MSDTQLLVNAPHVVSEIIDGEVVIMNLKSGNYHSSDKVGAVVWAWIEEGRTLSEIERLGSGRYAASRVDIRRALRAFVDRLIAEGLVREVALERDASARSTGSPPENPAGGEPFQPPELCSYTDMQDLLLLDPIHDVDDGGWPRPKDD